MQKRKLRIVKKSPPPAIGVCERCNVQFKSSLPYPYADIQVQFEDHKCESIDTSQNALRIVRESTEGK
ncbi:MAG: hypothetical protein WAL89_22950 [Candidatus Sulfotelmatobacter sp.]|jgi:hypothetical protein